MNLQPNKQLPHNPKYKINLKNVKKINQSMAALNYPTPISATGQAAPLNNSQDQYAVSQSSLHQIARVHPQLSGSGTTSTGFLPSSQKFHLVAGHKVNQQKKIATKAQDRSKSNLNLPYPRQASVKNRQNLSNQGIISARNIPTAHGLASGRHESNSNPRFDRAKQDVFMHYGGNQPQANAQAIPKQPSAAIQANQYPQIASARLNTQGTAEESSIVAQSYRDQQRSTSTHRGKRIHLPRDLYLKKEALRSQTNLKQPPQQTTNYKVFQPEAPAPEQVANFEHPGRKYVSNSKLSSERAPQQPQLASQRGPRIQDPEAALISYNKIQHSGQSVISSANNIQKLGKNSMKFEKIAYSVEKRRPPPQVSESYSNAQGISEAMEARRGSYNTEASRQPPSGKFNIRYQSQAKARPPAPKDEPLISSRPSQQAYGELVHKASEEPKGSRPVSRNSQKNRQINTRYSQDIENLEGHLQLGKPGGKQINLVRDSSAPQFTDVNQMITPSVILSKLSRNSSKEPIDPKEKANWGLNNSYHPQIQGNGAMNRDLITSSRVHYSEKDGAQLKMKEPSQTGTDSLYLQTDHRQFQLFNEELVQHIDQIQEFNLAQMSETDMQLAAATDSERAHPADRGNYAFYHFNKQRPKIPESSLQAKLTKFRQGPMSRVYQNKRETLKVKTTARLKKSTTVSSGLPSTKFVSKVIVPAPQPTDRAFRQAQLKLRVRKNDPRLEMEDPQADLISIQNQQNASQDYQTQQAATTHKKIISRGGGTGEQNSTYRFEETKSRMLEEQKTNNSFRRKRMVTGGVQAAAADMVSQTSSSLAHNKLKNMSYQSQPDNLMNMHQSINDSSNQYQLLGPNVNLNFHLPDHRGIRKVSIGASISNSKQPQAAAAPGEDLLSYQSKMKVIPMEEMHNISVRHHQYMRNIENANMTETVGINSYLSSVQNMYLAPIESNSIYSGPGVVNSTSELEPVQREPFSSQKDGGETRAPPANMVVTGLDSSLE